MIPSLHLVAPVFATDPLYAKGIGWIVLLIVLVKVLVVFGALMVSVMLMIWFERKVISDMQSRIGPNRAGPFGIAQTLADGLKLFFKEDLIPDKADRFVFKLAPYLTVIPAFLAFAIVPIGGEVTLFGHTFELQLADPPMGILFLLAVSAIGVYGIMLAGWASGSKYPLLGSVRASAQMISYEAALGMTVVMVVLVTGSLSTRAIVNAQAAHLWQWNAIRLAVVPFLIFFIAVVAETNRPPFDLAEQDVGGRPDHLVGQAGDLLHGRAVLGVFDLGQIEHLVDEVQQMHAGSIDLAHEVALFRLQGFAFQQLGKTQDGIHRRAQFMAHARDEIGFRAAGALCFFLGRTHGHPG